MLSTVRKNFTTGQVARICEVAPRTVSKWFDTGRLMGYKIPGSNDRRIPRTNLIKFMKLNGWDTSGLERETVAKVLLVGTDRRVTTQTMAAFDDPKRHEFAFAETVFHAGLMFTGFAPNIVVIDTAIGRSQAAHIARSVGAKPNHGGATLIAIAGEDEAAPDELLAAGFDAVFKNPFDVADLVARIAKHNEEFI